MAADTIGEYGADLFISNELKLLKRAKKAGSLLLQAAFSAIVGGWISKGLLVPNKESNASFIKSFSRIFTLVILSLAALSLHELYMIWNPDIYSDHRISWIVFYTALLLVCGYKSLRYLLKLDFSKFVQWLSPISAVIFSFTLASTYWYEIEYAKAYADFYRKEAYYTHEVAKEPANKNGLPKLVTFNLPSVPQEPELIVYDESDDMENIKSNHINFFLQWPKPTPNFVPPKNLREFIYHIRAKKITEHFYFTYLDYGEQPISYIV